MVDNAAKVGNALYWDDGRCFDLFAFKQKNPAVLLQLIGYKDMVNDDICEGDILKDDIGRILLVEWHQGGFTFKAITKTNFVRARRISEWFEWGAAPKIIGNIYEDKKYGELANYE
jgi:hypothetical protein